MSRFSEADLKDLAAAVSKIAKAPPGQPETIADPPTYTYDDIVRRMERNAMENSGRFRFNRDMNIGQVIQSLLFAAGILGGVIYYMNEQVLIKAQLATITAQGADRAQSVARQGTAIDAALNENVVQNLRIQNLADSSVESRRVQAEILTQLGQIREDVARLSVRLGVDRRSELGTGSTGPR